RLRAESGARRVPADGRHDAGARARAHQAVDAARDVVDVRRLLEPLDERACVATAVARVEHERDAREVGAPDLVRELRRLETRLLLGDAPGIAGASGLRDQ